jgi:hypothetical protein
MYIFPAVEGDAAVVVTYIATEMKDLEGLT